MTITEAQHQAAIIELATLLGWSWYHVPDSRRCPPGFPDLVLCRPPVVVFAELKTDRGRVRPAQVEWLERLSQCSRIVSGVWRPGDWVEIEQVLRGSDGY